MTEEQIDLFGDSMLLKIAAITGWMLPTDVLLNMLQEQFKKKMLESYAYCNPEEIEYAFRNFGSYVKDWGKQMNLNLIDEVMRPYLAKRREQSFAEEAAVIPPEPMSEESLSHFAMIRWLAREIRFIQTGKPWEFIPTELYDYLDKRGSIKVSNEEKYAYLTKATEKRCFQLEGDALKSTHAKEYFQRFRKMMDKGYLWGDEVDVVKRMAKKLLFFDLAQNYRK